MKLNRKRIPLRTHEGGRAKYITPELQLRRSVMACLLWEDTFYEDGVEIAERIASLVPQVDPDKVAGMAIEAREKMKLRHVPLLLVREMARNKTHRHLVADTLERVIQRADELTEFLAIYWKDGRQPLSAQVKKGLARAFTKFDAYQLAKYNRDGQVKLRDVLFLVHAKPKNEEQAETWKKLVDGTLESPDTWEVALSASKGEGKREIWERLLRERRLGALALLRNLRNFIKEGVDESLVKEALQRIRTERVLPFRFITAARYAPQWEPELEQAMFKALEEAEKLEGRTVLLVDVSYSMESYLSGRSEVTRTDVASGLAVLLREICEDVRIYTFSDECVLVPPRRGFALIDAIENSQEHGGTYLGEAYSQIEKTEKFDRIIVITDEQAHDDLSDPKGKGYVINVGSYQNGVGYGAWIHIDGWSEAVVDYIRELEKLMVGSEG